MTWDHEVTLPPDEVRFIRRAVEEAIDRDDFGDFGFSRTGGTQDDPLKDWLVGKLGEAIFARFVRSRFGQFADYDLDFGDDFDLDAEADSRINGEAVPLDVKTLAPGHEVCAVLEGVYEPHEDDVGYLYVYVSLDDRHDVKSDDWISGRVVGALPANELSERGTRIEKGEWVTSYDGEVEFYDADEAQYVVYPEHEVYQFSEYGWKTHVLDELGFPQKEDLSLLRYSNFVSRFPEVS